MDRKLIIFAGPSGVGKATIEAKLFADPSLKLMFSCSATTRPPRLGEIQGRHYYFLSEQEFDEKIKKNQFFEWNKHFFHKYGTLKSELERINKLGYVPFLEIDVEGAKQIIKRHSREYHLITIFIMPPSVSELERRIRARATESELQLQERLVRYNKEIEDSKFFDHVIVNDDLDKVVATIREIVQPK